MKKSIIKLVVFLVIVYLLVGAVVCLRAMNNPSAVEVADTYVQALKDRDLQKIYRYSDMLGPHLSEMMAKSGMSVDGTKHMWAKDYARWKMEFQRGSKSRDSLRRERHLLTSHAEIEPADVETYESEVVINNDLKDVETYKSVPGLQLHRYYRLSYPAADKAPEVGILDNITTDKKRRIKSLVFRVEVNRRRDLDGLKATLLKMAWIESLNFAYPFSDSFPKSDPSEIWMARVSFKIDKMTLETF